MERYVVDITDDALADMDEEAYHGNRWSFYGELKFSLCSNG